MNNKGEYKNAISKSVASTIGFFQRIEWVNTKRSLDQDIIKGIFIVLLVIYHLLKVSGIGYDIITAICNPMMVFFFVVTGYNHRRQVNKGEYGSLMFRRFKQLIVPVVICSTICFIVLLLYGYCANVKGFNPATWTTTYFEMWLSRSFLRHYKIKFVSFVLNCFVVNWFFIVLFISYALFYLIVNYVLKDMKRLFPAIVILLMITTILCVYKVQYLPFCLGIVPLTCALQLLGSAMRKYNFLDFSKKKIWQIVIECLIASAILFYLAYSFKTFGMLQNGEIGLNPKYGIFEPLYTFALGFISTYALYRIGYLLSRLRYFNFFAFFSQNAVYYCVIHLTIGRFFGIVLNIPPYNPKVPYSLYNTLCSILNIVIVLTICTAIVIIIKIVKQWLKERKNNHLIASTNKS